jgi:hypothetical protein
VSCASADSEHAIKAGAWYGEHQEIRRNRVDIAIWPLTESAIDLPMSAHRGKADVAITGGHLRK